MESLNFYLTIDFKILTVTVFILENNNFSIFDIIYDTSPVEYQPRGVKKTSVKMLTEFPRYVKLLL